MGSRRQTRTAAPPRRTSTEDSLSRSSQKAREISPGDAAGLITQLKTENRRLRERQKEVEETGKRYFDLYDFAPVGYFIFNETGTIADANLTGARLLGLPKNQIIGTPFSFFLDWGSMRLFLGHLKKVFSGEVKESCELRMSRKHGESVQYVLVESIPAPDRGRSNTCLSAVIDVTEKKHAERTLSKTHEGLVEDITQLRRLSAGLLERQEDERCRVAGDVHDSFASLLCVIKSRLQSLLGKGEDESLNTVLGQVDIAIRDARRIQMGLRPPVLDDLGLLSGLSVLCREFGGKEPRVHVRKEVALEERSIPDSIKVPIYRITQEAFDNIAVHSGADSVTISLARKDSFIHLVIRDNGRGFDLGEIVTGGTGGGLSTMRERAVLSGGLFNIESAPGKGTTIRVSWPFP